MINFFKKIVYKEFEKISWGKIKFKIGNIFEKKYVGKTGDLGQILLSMIIAYLEIWCSGVI